MFVLFWALQYPLNLTTFNLFPADAEPLLGLFSARFMTVVILALVTGILPVILNRSIIRFFEGYDLGAIIFAPFLARFRKMHREHYAPTQRLREERLALLTAYEQTDSFDEEADTHLHTQLQATHAAREEKHRVPRVPFDPNYLRPTAFGNVWATAEEIPRSRYGMDGMVFWPYMRTIIMQENPPLIANIDGQKLLMDTTLHLALICGVLVLVSAVTVALAFEPATLLVMLAFMLVTLLFYRAAVGYAATMNQLIVQTYDLYRWDLLEHFGLTPPDDLDDEYWVWQRLGAFLQRSEPFYFQYLGIEDN